MDASTVFVLLISAFVVGILAYLEIKSRRTKGADPAGEREGQ